MATAEKALIDILYLSSSRSKIFTALPELDFDEINVKKAKRIIEKIPFKSKKTFVQNKFNALFK